VEEKKKEVVVKSNKVIS
jgi:hypothetical protein